MSFCFRALLSFALLSLCSVLRAVTKIDCRSIFPLLRQSVWCCRFKEKRFNLVHLFRGFRLWWVGSKAMHQGEQCGQSQASQWGGQDAAGIGRAPGRDVLPKSQPPVTHPYQHIQWWAPVSESTDKYSAPKTQCPLGSLSFQSADSLAHPKHWCRCKVLNEQKALFLFLLSP